jgi:thymidylate synthase ThyX
MFKSMPKPGYTKEQLDYLGTCMTSPGSDVSAVFACPNGPIKNVDELGAVIGRSSRLGTRFENVLLDKERDDKGFIDSYVHRNHHESLKDQAFVAFVIDAYPYRSVERYILTHPLNNPQVQSSRYVEMDIQKLLDFAKTKIPDIGNSRFKGEIIDSLEHSYKMYETAKEEITDYMLDHEINRPFIQKKDAKTRKNAMDSSLDLARYFLTHAFPVRMGMVTNIRSLETILTNLNSSDIKIDRMLASRLYQEASKVAPAYVNQGFGSNQDHIDYISGINRKLDNLLSESPIKPSHDKKVVTFTNRPVNPDVSVPAVFLWTRGLGSFRDYLDYVERNEDVSKEVLKITHRERSYPLLSENLMVSLNGVDVYELNMDEGASRDMRRMRRGFSAEQVNSTKLGHDFTPEIEKIYGGAGILEDARDTFKYTEETFDAIYPEEPNVAPFVANLGHRKRRLENDPAGQLAYLIQLRSSRFGHPSYRRAIFEIAKEVKRRSPGFYRSQIEPNMDFRFYPLELMKSFRNNYEPEELSV